MAPERGRRRRWELGWVGCECVRARWKVSVAPKRRPRRWRAVALHIKAAATLEPRWLKAASVGSRLLVLQQQATADDTKNME